MSEYVELVCEDCASPIVLHEGMDAPQLRCDCVERAPVVLHDVERAGLLDPNTGLWQSDEWGARVCRDCGGGVTLFRKEHDGYYLLCECQNRSLSPGPVGDHGVFDPFGGVWATINDTPDA